MALKMFVHQIPIYNVIVTESGVMRWEEKKGEIFVQLSLKLQDFWREWPGHSTHFILLYKLFGNIFSPLPFKELRELCENASR